jgi:hypothetical protein
MTVVVPALVAASLLAAAAYPDPRGDVQGGAGPDILSVRVTHTPSALVFRVRFASAPPLSVGKRSIDMLLVGIDVPPFGPAPAAEGWRGADFSAGVHAGQASGRLVRMKVRGWPVVARVPVATRGAEVSLTVPTKPLGAPASIRFTVAAGRESESGGGSDLAPARGTYRYVIR